jgi:hypothetical protein
LIDCQPIFVIHGVNVRSERQFRADVAELNSRVGSTWRFIPIFWGDLGAHDDGVTATVPRQSAEVSLQTLLNVAARNTRADIAEIVAAAAAQEAMTKSTDPWRKDLIYADVEEEWRRTECLRLIEDPVLAEEIGAAIGDALAATSDNHVGSVRTDETRGITAGIVQVVDRVVGGVVGRLLGQINTSVRTNFGPIVARFLGDAFVFERDSSEIVSRLTDKVWQERRGTAERPASILAHSLGGVIAFNAAVRASDAIHIDRFVTFGSQSAFFHVIREIGEVPRFDMTAVRLPARIDRWLNVWEPLDPLAFLAAGVFQMSSGDSPIDRELPHRPAHTLWTHSSYWKDPTFAAWVREFLS